MERTTILCAMIGLGGAIIFFSGVLLLPLGTSNPDRPPPGFLALMTGTALMASCTAGVWVFRLRRKEALDRLAAG